MKQTNAGIVTYNPDIDRLKDNIEAIVDQVYSIIIVDNGSKSFSDIQRLVLNYNKITLIQNIENLGIAFALNQIMYSEEFDEDSWVLLLDQDSISPPNIIEEYKKYLNFNNAAVICPRINDLNSNQELFRTKKPKEKFIYINHCITSGSLFSVKVWKEIKGADNKLFIDYVDNDLSIRVFNHGYRIIRNNEVILKHEIGKKSKHLFCSTYNHTAFRKYYMTRNTIYCALKYSNYAKENYLEKNDRVAYIKRFDNMPSVKHAYLKILKRLFIVLLHEEDKKDKALNMIKGVRDARLMYLSNKRY